MDCKKKKKKLKFEYYNIPERCYKVINVDIIDI